MTTAIQLERSFSGSTYHNMSHLTVTTAIQLEWSFSGSTYHNMSHLKVTTRRHHRPRRLPLDNGSCFFEAKKTMVWMLRYYSSLGLKRRCCSQVLLSKVEVRAIFTAFVFFGTTGVARSPC